MEAFQGKYPLEYRCEESYEQILENTDLIAVTTTWPQFKRLKEETDKPSSTASRVLWASLQG